MRAIIRDRYGSPDMLALRDVAKPTIDDDQVLVRVKAASVNALDWHMLTGTPYLIRLQTGLRRPRDGGMGADVAGIVEAVGDDVTRFTIGDEVFGEGQGAFAEYAAVKETVLTHKPEPVSFEHAAASGVAGLTALQGLIEKGRLIRGQHVLINGASGSVGTFAIQIAKAYGAEVTAVCSTRNVVQATEELGADHVIDYTTQDFGVGGARFDVMFDIVGRDPIQKCRSVINSGGTYVVVGGPKGKWLGPLPRLVRALLIGVFTRTRMVGLLAQANPADLKTLAGLLESGAIVPAIERLVPLDEVPDAIAYQGAGHARAKTVITI